VVDEVLREPEPLDPYRTHDAVAEAAGVHRSYAGEVLRNFEDLIRSLAEVTDPPNAP
jgi:hypothetical protein